MTYKELIANLNKQFAGKTADLGYLIGDYDMAHSQQTYGSGTEPTKMEQDIVRSLAGTFSRGGFGDRKQERLDVDQSEKAVRMALAIIRQANYAGINVNNFTENELKNTIEPVAKTKGTLIRETVFNGTGILDGHESMKAKVAAQSYPDRLTKPTTPTTLTTPTTPTTPTSPTGDLTQQREDLSAEKKQAEEDKRRVALAGGVDPMSVAPAPTAAQAELGVVGATNPFGNIQGAEAAYAALSPRQIAAGMPSTLAGAFSPFAQQTYRQMLSPLAQENGVYEFLSVAGLAPRMAMPNDPSTVNDALSFRAFLSQDPNAITKNISQGLSLLESAKTKASSDMQGFLAGTNSTTEERLLYQEFLKDPAAEFNLRSALADRAYPGVVGDAIKGALSDQYYSTLSTNPIALSQPGFYKNAFANYMPTATMTNFVSSTGETLDENETKAVVANAAKIVTNEGTPDDKDDITANSTEKVIAKVNPAKADPTVVQQLQGEEPGVRTDLTPTTDPRLVKDLTTPTPTPTPAPVPTPAPSITDPTNLLVDDMGGLPPIGTPPIGTTPIGTPPVDDPMATTTLNPMLAPAVGGEMIGERMADRTNPFATQIQSDMQYVPPGVGNVNPLLDDLGMTPSLSPLAMGPAGEMMGERMLTEQDLNPDLQDMDAINYGYNQPIYSQPISPTGYYVEQGVTDPLMADLGMTPSTLPPVGGEMLGERQLASTLPPAGEMINEGMTNYLSPSQSFAQQFPYSPSANPMSSPTVGGEIPATFASGLGGYNPVPKATNPLGFGNELNAAYRSFLTQQGIDPRKYTFDMFLRDRNKTPRTPGFATEEMAINTGATPGRLPQLLPQFQQGIMQQPPLGAGGGLAL